MLSYMALGCQNQPALSTPMMCDDALQLYTSNAHSCTPSGEEPPRYDALQQIPTGLYQVIKMNGWQAAGRAL